MNRDHGPDYSFWQGEINPSIAVQNDAKIILFRGGSMNLFTGECYEDFQYERNEVEIPAVADSGIYWYTRLNKNWIEQMEFLINLIKRPKPKPFTIRPTLDVEEYKDQYGNVIYKNVLQARLKICVDMLYEEFNVWPIIYTRTSVWNPYFGNPTWEVKKCPLFIARYVFGSNAPDNILEICDTLQPYTSSVPLPYPWQPYDWTLWQCTADDNKLGTKYGVPLPPYGTLAVDLSLTNGKKADFMAKAGMIPQPDPEPIPGDDEVKQCKVTLPAGQTYRNMRAEPDATYVDGDPKALITGSVYPSDTAGDKTLPVFKEITNSEGTWYLVMKESLTVGWVLAIVGTTHYLTLV